MIPYLRLINLIIYSEFNVEVAFADEAMVLDIIINSDTFSEFRPRLEGTPHSAPHLYLGEHMESMVRTLQLVCLLAIHELV